MILLYYPSAITVDIFLAVLYHEPLFWYSSYSLKPFADRVSLLRNILHCYFEFVNMSWRCNSLPKHDDAASHLMIQIWAAQHQKCDKFVLQRIGVPNISLPRSVIKLNHAHLSWSGPPYWVHCCWHLKARWYFWSQAKTTNLQLL